MIEFLELGKQMPNEYRQFLYRKMMGYTPKDLEEMRSEVYQKDMLMLNILTQFKENNG